MIGTFAYFPVLVNDAKTIGTIDTGAVTTSLTQAVVSKAKIGINHGARPHRMHGISGGFNVLSVYANTIQYGGMKIVDPPPSDMLDFAGSNSVLGANIGLDLMDGFDWDLDFPQGRMTAFRTKNCADIDPAWITKSTGLAITRGFPNSRKFAGLTGL